MSAVSVSSHRSGGSAADKNRWGFGSSSKAPSAVSSAAPSKRGGSKKAPPGAGALPLSGMSPDIDGLTEDLQKAMAMVRAAESSLNGQIAEHAQRMESRVDVAHRSERRLSEDLMDRTKELFEAQFALEACQNEVESQRASAAAESQYRNTLMLELAKANEAVVSIKDEQQGLEDELQQTRDEISARDVELQQARDELPACIEGQSAAQLREHELEERLDGLQEMERTLQAELVDTQAALQARSVRPGRSSRAPTQSSRRPRRKCRRTSRTCKTSWPRCRPSSRPSRPRLRGGRRVACFGRRPRRLLRPRRRPRRAERCWTAEHFGLAVATADAGLPS
jgi:hypothetical protein